ncbi:MAG: hypothetical protein ACP5KZ_05875 [bacterium]
MRSGLRIGITHRKIDLDAGSCIRFLQRMGEVDEVDFGIEKAEEYKNAGKILFVDTYPYEVPKDVEVEIYSQHLLEKILDEEQLRTMLVSSFDLLTAEKGIAGFDEERMEKWGALVRHSDFKKDIGEMDIKRALSHINSFLELSDREVYERWFVPLMDSFLERDKDIEKGTKIFNEVIQDYLLNNPESVIRDTLNKWREKIKQPEKMDALRNIFHLLCYLEEKVGKEWLLLIFQARERSQQDFLKTINSKELFESIRIDFGGKFLVISQVTSTKNFPSALRYLTRTGSSLIPHFVVEKTLREQMPYIMILVNPETLNFFISSGIIWEPGNWKVMQKLTKETQEIFSELVKAIRAEILIRKEITINEWQNEVLSERRGEMRYLFKLSNILSEKNPTLADIVRKEAISRMEENIKKMPPPWVLLSQPCDIALTRPLFFNKKEFSQILWGSATHPAPPATIFGKTGEEIRRELVEIAKLAIDKDYFPPFCNPRKCLGCPMELWYLKKCLLKRGSPA